ncbi:uncharacterized protein LOC131658389 [Vicia villosa]|uniref:uncharacterized protein LOC131658389 n=1 Tax=Vicia villosa TaxID=3911 RepID=UPI00273B6F28|nr:uncharacterized protein LOC131658389 [Vicia villosa]
MEDLFPEIRIIPSCKASGSGISKSAQIEKDKIWKVADKQPKSFVEAVNNVCDIPISQFPTPCLKGDRLAIVIPKDEYQKGVEACKHNLHGRVIWTKGSKPLTVQNLKEKEKLLGLWKSLGKWGLTSLGKGYFEFSFSSLEDVRKVRSISSWNLNPGILKLFTWSKDFNPAMLKQSSAQVWVCIHGLAQEYWRPKIVFAIASSVGTPLCTDSASNSSCFERPFGHFVRVLVDMDLTKELRYKVLVERQGFAFFVELEYEKLPEFCNHCICIGHNTSKCKRKETIAGVEGGKHFNKVTEKVVTQVRNSEASPSVGVEVVVPTEENKDDEHASDNPIHTVAVVEADPIIDSGLRRSGKEPLENFIEGRDDENSEEDSSFIDATQDNFEAAVPDTNNLQINKDLEFLNSSWANMVETE